MDSTHARTPLISLCSKEHRSAIAERCIAKTLSKAIEERDDENGEGEHREGTLEQKIGKGNTSYDWESPLRMRWKWNRLFLLYTAHFERAAPKAFARLRIQEFQISQQMYFKLFSTPMEALSNMGLSGSTFFHTASHASEGTAGLLVKSINRAFEYEFLHTTLLQAYLSYYEKEGRSGNSLLSRIVDVIWCADATLGGMLRLTPRHYMIMVDIIGNILEGARKWDLKPLFFEPTRDLVPDNLKSEATKSGLADTLEPEIRIKLTESQYTSLLKVILKDTEFLQNLGVVDYSLLFGRFPASSKDALPVPLGFEHHVILADRAASHTPSRLSTVLRPNEPSHRDERSNWDSDGDAPSGADFIGGVLSSDGEWIYRMTIVDFLWNVDKFVPVAMRTAGKAIHMPDQTITTQPQTYRDAFLKMIDEYVEVSKP